MVFGQRHVIRLNAEAIRRVTGHATTATTPPSRARDKAKADTPPDAVAVAEDTLPITQQHLFNFIAPNTPSFEEDGANTGGEAAGDPPLSLALSTFAQVSCQVEFLLRSRYLRLKRTRPPFIN